MADQMYSMCWGPAQYQQREDEEDDNKIERQTDGGLSLKTDETTCVTIASDTIISPESNCKTPGYCVNGKRIDLNYLSQHGLEVELPAGMVLAGAKSPLLDKMILVAAVDKRFLPCDTNLPTTLGFSGSCVGCGDPHFRYFTEFANHINLILATQPKKQKHLKCYVLRDNLGRLCRGPRIPWRDPPRKRTFPYPDYQPILPAGQQLRHVTSEAVTSSAFIAPQSGSSSGGGGVVMMKHGNIGPLEGRSSTSSQSSSDSAASNIYNHSERTSLFYKRPRVTTTTTGGSSNGGSSGGDVLPPSGWLEAACGVKPVLVLGFPREPSCFMTDTKEMLVSDVLADCFKFLNTSSRTTNVGGSYNITVNRLYPTSNGQTRGSPDSNTTTTTTGSSAMTSLSPVAINVLIVLMAQYLSSLSNDVTISKEEFLKLLRSSKELFWQTYHENNTIQPYITNIDASNLIHFANIATLPSNGSVKLLSSMISLNDTINKGLGFLCQITKHNQHREIKLTIPNYLLLIATPQGKHPQFCVIVTGVNQAKLLQENMLIDIPTMTSQELNDIIAVLDKTYHMLNLTINNLLKQFEPTSMKNKLVFLPFNGNSVMKVTENEAMAMSPKAILGTSPQSSLHIGVHVQEVTSAHQLLSAVLGSKDGLTAFNLHDFSTVDFALVVPSSITYYHQVMNNVRRSKVLLELGLAPPTQAQDPSVITEHIIQHNGSESSKHKMKELLKNAESCSDVLYVVVCDEAHKYFNSDCTTDVPFFDQIIQLHNVLVIFNTPVPYRFQTCQSRIRPDNEVYWSDVTTSEGCMTSSDHEARTNGSHFVHFGMREYTESLNWTHQIPLIREDDEFEGLALKANLMTSVPSSLIRGYLLMHHYTTAIMWSAGMRSIEPHCTLKTLQVIADIIESPLRSIGGRGVMLIIRVPSPAFATWAHNKLRDIRDKVGFRYRFAVINDDGQSDIILEDYFLQRLRLWRNNEVSANTKKDWYPKSYEDLLDLPAIVLISGRQRSGDTFPRSLKYGDLRLLNEECFHRATLELELNVISRYFNSSNTSNAMTTTTNNSLQSSSNKQLEHDIVNKSKLEAHNQFCSNYPLPVLLVSRTAHRILQKDFFGCPKHLCLCPDPDVIWNSDQRSPLVSDLPCEQSKYYRHWTKPKTQNEGSFSACYPRCFLFSGPPQVGTTASVLHFIRLLYGTLLKLQRVDVYDEVPDSSQLYLVPAFDMDQPNTKILSNSVFHPTLVGTRFSTVSPLLSPTPLVKTEHDVIGSSDVAPTSSVMMSPFAAFDSYHHCDECKIYREGLGLSSSTKHVLTLGTGDQLTFVIPSARREWFTFDQNNELCTLKLPVVTRSSTSEAWKLEGEHRVACMTPIMTSSVGRHEQGLLNLFHAMENRDHVHLVFVKNNELIIYQKIWPNHVIVALPPACNYKGLGMTKHLIKEFATQNLMYERRRNKCEKTHLIWPFVHVMDDTCVMWQCSTVENNFSDDSHSKPGEWSLLQTTRLVESCPDITSSALIGFNHWGTGNQKEFKLNSYSVCQVHCSVFLNIDVTHHVSYNQRLFSWEQVDFNLRVSNQGGLVLRYNHLNVLQKRILIGGRRTYNVTSNIDDVISFPDRDPGHMIAAPAHYLLEEYLCVRGTEMFPAASGNPLNPVLLLHCFFNLRPSITVEYRTKAVLGERARTETSHVYGGILLYLCAGCDVMKDELRDLRFCPGAKICVISSDRSTLRDHVVKLDLEEHWRFRLRDEFKTASSLTNEHLYFLTGTYDG